MNITRTTVTAIYDIARKKVADDLVNGKRLLICLSAVAGIAANGS